MQYGARDEMWMCRFVNFIAASTHFYALLTGNLLYAFPSRSLETRQGVYFHSQRGHLECILMPKKYLSYHVRLIMPSSCDNIHHRLIVLNLIVIMQMNSVIFTVGA